jgi:hypothetical protein
MGAPIFWVEFPEACFGLARNLSVVPAAVRSEGSLKEGIRKTPPLGESGGYLKCLGTLLRGSLL